MRKRPSPIRWATFVLASALVGLGAGYGSVGHQSAETTSSSTDADFSLTKEGAAALGSHALVFTGDGGEIYLADASGVRRLTSATRLTDANGDHPFVATSAAFSPTGKWIAYQLGKEAYPGDIYLVDPSGNGRRKLADRSAIGVAPWNPTGTALAVVSAAPFEEGIVRVSVPSGQQTRITFGPWLDSQPSWSPDGLWIAFTRESIKPPKKGVPESNEVWVVPPKGGKAHLLLRDGYYHLAGPTWSRDSKVVYADRHYPGRQPPPGKSVAAIDLRAGTVRTLNRMPDPQTADGTLSRTAYWQQVIGAQ